MTDALIKNCDHCGSPFHKGRRKPSQWKTMRYCSHPCAIIGNAKKRRSDSDTGDKLCANCGITFSRGTRRPTDWNTQLYCSNRCVGIANSNTIDKILSPENFDIRNECRVWRHAKHPFGYGAAGLNKKVVIVHRIAYEKAFGPIPDGLYVLHRCDNPPCCNPDHLFLGTYYDNMADMVAKGRQSKGESKSTSILTESAVREIRESTARHVDLGHAYGVCASTISQVRSRKRWRHVP